MKKTIQREYAKLIAKSGVAVKKNDVVIIQADLDQPDFIAMLVDECYKAGASRVDLEWGFQAITKLHYRHRSLKSLSEVPLWQEEKLKLMVDEVPCRIYIDSEDPDGLKGVNRDKMQKSQMARYKVTKKYSDALENKDQWTIAAVPSYAWAKKVFPNETKRNAYNKLWDAILKTVYVTKDNDPVKEGDPDRCQVFIAVGDWDYRKFGGTPECPVQINTLEPSTYFNPKSEGVIGYGCYVSNKSTDGWIKVEIPIEYVSTSRKPTHIIVSCAASMLGDYFTGSDQSTLWVDGMELHY